MKEFKEILREVLFDLKLTQKKAAEIIGVPLRTFENWVGGINEPDKFKANAVVEKLAEYISEDA